MNQGPRYYYSLGEGAHKPYYVWGRDLIDPNAVNQMNAAMSIAPAVAGALMPDAHLGYGLPIGGVLALDNAVCPYAVGVDIACRMKMSIYDQIDLMAFDYETGRGLQHGYYELVDALKKNTFFGVGVDTPKGKHYDHPVLYHEAWEYIDVLHENMVGKDGKPGRAITQLGTSGSGNHFVEFGILDVPFDGTYGCNERLQLEPGKYVAVMSHSGSRGTGAAVCAKYSKIAKELHPELANDPLTRDLGWLDLDTDAGREYWLAMNVMGDYAKANHDCIHDSISKYLGVTPLKQIENHHNFAWKEMHNGREVIVHRKGATPAGAGILGVIPGSMGTPAYVVSGLGCADSLSSASHGAGRVMSRKQAKTTFDYKTEIAKLAANGITVLSAGADEVCGVYKNIDDVMAAQTDLVEPVAKFLPKIVKMCGSGDRAED